jgi:glycosyltransferase involved in cell wall biosynthesis
VLHIAQMLPGGIISYIEELLPTQMAQFGPANIMALVAAKDAGLLSTMARAACTRSRKADARCANCSASRAGRSASCARTSRHRPPAQHLCRPAAPADPAGLPQAEARHHLLRPWLGLQHAHGPLEANLYAMVERALSHCADHIICISAFEYRSALERGISPARMTMIENAITSRPRPAGKAPFRPAEGINLLFIGRFDKQKGFDIAEAAMDLVRCAGHAPCRGRFCRQRCPDAPSALQGQAQYRPLWLAGPPGGL